MILSDLKGSISAEHGIGQMKREEMSETAPPVALDLMRRIKSVLRSCRDHESGEGYLNSR